MQLIHLAIKKVINTFFSEKYRILIGLDQKFQGLFKFIKATSNSKYERIFLVSERIIYKLETFNITSFQWAIAIDSIDAIKLSKDNKCLLVLLVKSNINKKILSEKKLSINSKDQYDFNFKYSEDLLEVVFLLKKNIYNINNSKTLVKIIS